MAGRRHRTRGNRRKVGAVTQLPFGGVTNSYPAVEILNPDQVEQIVDGALTILATKGMRFLHEESRRRLIAAGGKADKAQQTIRFDREMVLEYLSYAPASFTLRARNSHRDLIIGENNIVFTSVGGPAFCSDLDKGRRPGTYAELCDYLRLVQSINVIHQEGGGAFEAMDLPPLSRHLDLYLAQFTLLDKNVQAYALGRDRTIDCIEMTCIALDTDRSELKHKPAVLGIINTNSPMQLDVPMSEAIIELASAGQVSCVTPFTLAGSMSPVSLAGTLVQQTAEVLAAVTLVQCVRPGAPVIYGSFASNVDMKSGSPALGTPPAWPETSARPPKAQSGIHRGKRETAASFRHSFRGSVRDCGGRIPETTRRLPRAWRCRWRPVRWQANHRYG